MLEPSKPVTLKIRYTPYPAVELQRDEGSALRPGSVILRHRHLKQQFTIVPSVSPQRPRASAAPPRCIYQLVAPSPAVLSPSAVPSVAALHVGAGPSSAAPSPATARSSAPSAAAPSAAPVADSSVVGPPVVTAALAAITPVVARADDVPASGIAAPSIANPLFAPVLATTKILPAVGGEGSGNVSPVQPLPVQAPSRNTARSHEIVETSNNSLVVRRGRRAIRDKKGHTTWFYSDGQTYLLEPPTLENACLGDLYVHTAANRDQQIWIFNRNSQWEKIQLYHPHPVLSGYVLHRVSDGEPRWIQKATVTTYKGRKKRYQQMCSRSDAEAASATSSGQVARSADTP